MVIVHDPQPLFVREHVPDKSRHWIWRCHIDLSTPHPQTIERLVPHIAKYDGSVFHLQEYVPAGVDPNNGAGPCTSARRRSTRCRRRTWRCRPRTPRSCATSSASTSTGR